MSSGFTLVDTLICVAILGIVSVMIIPAVNTALIDTRLSSAGEEVYLALEFAQVSAVRSGRPTRVTIDDALDTILVEQIVWGDSLLDSNLGSISQTTVECSSYAVLTHPLQSRRQYHIGFADQYRFSGVDIYSSDFGPGSGIVFDAKGAPSLGGAVILTHGDQALKIMVDAAEGRVREPKKLTE